jgi:hypothetical protein
MGVETDFVLISEGRRVLRNSVRAAKLSPAGDYLQLFLEIGGEEIKGFVFTDGLAASKWLRQRFPYVTLERVLPDGKRVISTPAVSEPEPRCPACE